MLSQNKKLSYIFYVLHNGKLKHLEAISFRGISASNSCGIGGCGSFLNCRSCGNLLNQFDTWEFFMKPRFAMVQRREMRINNANVLFVFAQ